MQQYISEWTLIMYSLFSFQLWLGNTTSRMFSNLLNLYQILLYPNITICWFSLPSICGLYPFFNRVRLINLFHSIFITNKLSVFQILKSLWRLSRLVFMMTFYRFGQCHSQEFVENSVTIIRNFFRRFERALSLEL